MSLITEVAQIIRKKKYVNHFLQSTRYPLQSQKEILLELVRKNCNTEYGKRYRFSDISSIEDYKKNLPIVRYRDISRYIKLIQQGKNNILTNEKVLLLGITSGTTGKPKYCPITESFIRDYKKDWDVWIYFANKDHKRMFDEKIFTIVSPQVTGNIGKMQYGSISGMMAENESALIRSFYAIPNSVFKIKDYEARHYTIIRIAIEKSISWIVTPNPSMILMLTKKAIGYREDIIADIMNGTISRKFKISEDIRKEIEKGLRPNSRRGKELINLKKSSFLPKNYWPNLSIIGCWKEGTLPIYLRQFPEYFGYTPVRDIGLLATEGRSTIPISDDGGKGVLAVSTHFYEFIPVDKKVNRRTRTLNCNELEQGKDYFILLSTSAGLYRYFINDVIRVVDFYNNTPVIQFLHKGEHVVSITGEKLTEWQVVHAMRLSTKRLSVAVDSFTLCTRLSRNPGYDLLIELHKKAPDSKLKSLIDGFDKDLMKLNIEYSSKRKSGRLKKPVLKVVSDGDFSRLHKKISRTSSHDSQVKLPSLTMKQGYEKNFNIIKVIK